MKKQNIRRAAAVLAVLALAACLASSVFADLTNGYTPDGNAFPYDADGYDGRDMTGRSGTNDSGLTDRNGMNDNALPGRDGVNDNDVIDDDMGDMLPPDKTLGDTDGDGLVEGPYADDGMPGANARARSADANGSGDTADGDGGMAWWGLLLALLAGAAVIVLVIALLSGTDKKDGRNRPDRS